MRSITVSFTSFWRSSLVMNGTQFVDLCQKKQITLRNLETWNSVSSSVGGVNFRISVKAASRNLSCVHYGINLSLHGRTIVRRCNINCTAKINPPLSIIFSELATAIGIILQSEVSKCWIHCSKVAKMIQVLEFHLRKCSKCISFRLLVLYNVIVINHLLVAALAKAFDTSIEDLLNCINPQSIDHSTNSINR